MYIKKRVLIISAIVLVLITTFLTIGFLNPFGYSNIDDFIHFSQLVRLTDTMFYQELDREELLRGAVKGMTEMTEDPYTGYLWGDDAKEYMEEVEGTYYGIGVYIENNIEDNTIEVVSAIAGSPAEEVGLTTGDKILKVNGIGYTGQEINEATSVMRGEAETEVTLTILQKSSGKTMEVVVERREITIQSVTGEMLTETVGKIDVSQFNTGSGEQFQKTFGELKKSGMEALILDLRNNPGGLIDEAVEIVDVFLKEGKVIVYTEDRNREREYYRATGSAEEISVVVLTNQGSASASEIVTGALKDYGVGYQIGEKTYGKGVVQGVYNTGELEILSLTVAQYFTPEGECIHEKGIKPDLEIPMDIEKYRNLTNLAPEDDEQIQAALEYLNS